MITIDANVLLYAYNKDSEFYAAASGWLESYLDGPRPLGLSWHILTAFLRISTNPRLFLVPQTADEASNIVSELLMHPNVHVLLPTAYHWKVFRSLIREGQVTGPLVMDAHLAALAVEHDARLATTDRDFARFPRLDFFNPLTQ